MAGNSIDELVLPALLEEWVIEIKPRWFADESARSQKTPGLLKSEFSIDSGQFVALSPKCYIFENGEKVKRSSKGIPKACQLDVQDFLDTLYEDREKSVQFGQITINKKLCSATTRICRRKALNNLYLKFHVEVDGVNCRPHKIGNNFA